MDRTIPIPTTGGLLIMNADGSPKAVSDGGDPSVQLYRAMDAASGSLATALIPTGTSGRYYGKGKTTQEEAPVARTILVQTVDRWLQGEQAELVRSVFQDHPEGLTPNRFLVLVQNRLKLAKNTADEYLARAERARLLVSVAREAKKEAGRRPKIYKLAENHVQD